MENVWFTAALWLGLAFLASMISIRVAISVALIEIMVGAVAGNTIGLQLTEWVNFLAGFGAILLTFLAGSEIDPQVVRDTRARAWDRRGRLLRPLSRGSPLRPLSCSAGLATGANRRHLALDDLGRRRLRGHGRDRLQQDRDRQDHPRRLLRQRLGHGLALGIVFAHYDLWLLLFGAVTAARLASCRASRRGSSRLLASASASQAEVRGPRSLGPWRIAAIAGARRSCPPILLAWPWRRPSLPTPSCRTACGLSPSPSRRPSTSSRPARLSISGR